jgi:CBS domain containing-hemolysin-like protein
MTGWMIAAALALVGLNAFFVAAEFGLVAARRPRIDQLVASGNSRAAVVQRAMGELNLLLSGCQLGITFASLGLGWIGEPAFADLLTSTFEPLPSPLNTIATHGTASVLAFVIITFLHVVLGELVPKNLAIAAPEQVALWVAVPMRAFAVLFRPFIWLFNEGANALVRLLGVEPQSELRSVHTLDEFRVLLEESQRAGVVQLSQGDIIDRLFDFPDKLVNEAMVPRSDVHAVGIDNNVDEVLEMARRTRHSRFPVFKGEPSEFVGVVHLADMLAADHRQPGAIVKHAMREPLFVPESLRLDLLLRQMNEARTHFAIALNEYGSTEGIVTLDDVLAELVGDIADEHRDPARAVRKLENGYRVPGAIHLEELERVTDLRLPEGDYETVGGFINDRLGHVARQGDEVRIDGWRIRVVAVRRHRILTVDVQPPNPIRRGRQ